jgi:hypothetical protein
VTYLDYLELHIWMVKENEGEFNKKTGYNFDRFEQTSYENLVQNGKRVYSEKPDCWKKLLTDRIQNVAEIAAKLRRPLMTSECWAVIDYKDWPLLEWDWVKELCSLGVKRAAQTGQWLAISTSNFCGPQFVGMWRDKQWHRNMTDVIKSAAVNEKLLDSTLAKRMSSFL